MVVELGVVCTVVVATVEADESVVTAVVTAVETVALLSWRFASWESCWRYLSGTYFSKSSRRDSAELEASRDDSEECPALATAWSTFAASSWQFARPWWAEARPRATMQHTNSASKSFRPESMVGRRRRSLSDTAC